MCMKTHRQYFFYNHKGAVGLTIHPTLSVQKVYVMPLLSTLKRQTLVQDKLKNIKCFQLPHGFEETCK